MIDWFEIFRTGTHTDSSGNTREWNESDLDKIVSGYKPEEHEAPIVIGHPVHNAPAFGWIEKLKRVGDRLLAFPKNVVKEFSDAVRAGIFKKRSISLSQDGTLRHVGFLGGAIPAVKGLKDLSFDTGESSTTIEIEESQKPSVPEVPPAPSPDETLLNRFTESEQRRIVAEKKISELETKIRFIEFSSFLAEKINKGIITPAQSGILINILQSSASVDFSIEKKDILPVLKEFVASLSPQFTLAEIATGNHSAVNKFPKSPSQIIAEEISKSHTSLTK